jgi:hypothetical protein
MAFDELTNSTSVAPVASLSLAAFRMPDIVVAHHGPPASPLLQLFFSTWLSKWRDVPLLPPSYTAPHPRGHARIWRPRSSL